MNEFYTEISKEEFYTSIDKSNLCDLTTTEYDKLKSLPEFVISEFLITASSFFLLPTTEYYNLESIGIYYRVYKTDDEWFYVAVEYNHTTKCYYYKCDQFEGLMGLLNSESLNESKTDEYYKQIDEGEFYDNDGYLGLNKLEVDKLRKWGAPSFERYQYLSSYPRMIFDNMTSFVHSVVGYAIIVISKCEDEWFYIKLEDYHNNHVEYYKCDQLSGVVKLLEDKLNKIFPHLMGEMKYIKMFEEYASYHIRDDWNNETESEGFTEAEIDYLNDFLKTYNIKIELINLMPQFVDFTIEIGDYIYRFDICKTLDEWYEVGLDIGRHSRNRLKSEYYKCDQLSGVIDLIKDIVK